jgi:hypothetical protein
VLCFRPGLITSRRSVLSMTFGRPLMLELKSSAPLPEMIDDEFLSTGTQEEEGIQPTHLPARCAFFISIIKLSHITAEILRLVQRTLSLCLILHASQLADRDWLQIRLFYFSTPVCSTRGFPTLDYASILRLDAALENWNEELPVYLQYEHIQESRDGNNLFIRQAHLLRHR